MKTVLHVMFSTNRVDYLKRTFEAQKNINFEGLKVHKMFIDDFPKGRDDLYISKLAESYGFKEVILHYRNLGITSTWKELFDNIKDRNYDYIFHQEDDVEPTKEIKVIDMVEALESDPNLSQIQLKRNNWYRWETEEYSVKDSDIAFKNYFIEKGSPYFWMLMSLYPGWISKIDYIKETGACPSEWTIAQCLMNKYNLKAGILKDFDGKNLVHHFGDLTKGKRVNENEPGWDKFKYNDPEKEYYSRNGQEAK
jgi:hypothetical protein